MTEPQKKGRLTRTASPDTSDAALAEIEARVRLLREAGDPHRNVATLEYLIRIAHERNESIRLARYGLDSSMTPKG